MIALFSKNIVVKYLSFSVDKSKNRCYYCLRLVALRNMKNKTTALILSILVGGLGVDRFYLGYTGMGILKLLTGGCFGVLWLIDLINIATGKLGPADGSPYDDDTALAPSAPSASLPKRSSRPKKPSF